MIIITMIMMIFIGGGVLVVKAMDSGIVVSKFKIQLSNTIGKGMNLLIFLAMS